MDSLRLADYTYAGGPDVPVLPGKRDLFKPVAYRQAFFDWLLSHSPDLVIANGDHIYRDYHSWPQTRKTLARYYIRDFMSQYCYFDESLPVLGSSKEKVLTRIFDE